MTSIKKISVPTIFASIMVVIGILLCTIGVAGLLSLREEYIVQALFLTSAMTISGIGYLVSAYVLFKYKGFHSKWSGYVVIASIILTVVSSPYLMMLFLSLVMCGSRGCGSL